MFTIVVDYGGSLLQYACVTIPELHFLVFVLEKDSEVRGYQIMRYNEVFDLSSQRWKVKKYRNNTLFVN